MVLISNATRQCALWHQQAAPPGESIIWDYHVIYLFLEGEQWFVSDFDSDLPWGLPISSYLLSTFDTSVGRLFAPSFRIMEGMDFLSKFSSDRRHMQDQRGNWLKPAPEWPVINRHSMHNLHQFIDMSRPAPGVIVNLETLRHLPPPE